MSFVLDWSNGIIHVNARSIRSMSFTDRLNDVLGFISLYSLKASMSSCVIIVYNTLYIVLSSVPVRGDCVSTVQCMGRSVF